MHTLAVAVAVFSAVCAFAFLFAGWVGLGGADEADRARLGPMFDQAKREGWLAEYRALGKARGEALRPERLARRWREEPQIRGLTYAGLLCILTSVISGSVAGCWQNLADTPSQSVEPTASRLETRL
jgi:hypothetical protein